MDAGLGSGVTHNADGLTRPFACASIGLGTLTPDGQAAQMPDASIAFNALQALQIHADLAAKIAFDNVFPILNGMNDLRKLLLGQVLGADTGIDIRPSKNLLRVGGADAINVAQCDFNALVRRNLYTNDACHKLIILAVVCGVCCCK